MNEKNYLKSLVTALALLTVFSCYASERPNVIIIYSDDQGAIDLNCYGSTDLLTPNIDALARRGVRFTQFYAAPLCSPSRASLMTGMTPQRAGLSRNAGSVFADKAGLPPERFTMGEMFQREGYQTALIGKWHLGLQPGMLPNDQGFDYSFGHLGGCIDNYSHFFYWQGANRHDLYRNGEEVYYPGNFFPDLMVEEAGRFLEHNKGKPFFLYFAINLPHYPYQGDMKWLEYYRDKGLPYPRDLYAAFISTLDERVGLLVDKVKELGLDDNTIIIFQSDNGYSTEERAHFGGGNAGVYRGAKSSLFEGGIRVPSIISWPGVIPEGEVRGQFAVCADWMPTLAEMCGIELETGDLDGKSIISVIQDASVPSPHEDRYCWKHGKSWAARDGKWKLLGYPMDTSKKGILTESDTLFLANLERDPGEMVNLARKQPEIVKRLQAQYRDWLERNAEK